MARSFSTQAKPQCSRPASAGQPLLESTTRRKHDHDQPEHSGSRPAGARAHALDGPLLRPGQVAARLSVTTSWAYGAVRAGSLPCIGVGRHIRFTHGC